MFGAYSYLGYTLLFCLPPIIVLWLRPSFRAILMRDAWRILFATALLTIYGSSIWPIAIHWGAWAYTPDKITGIIVLGYVHLEDVVWWLLVSFLIASFVSVMSALEKQGRDFIAEDARRLFSKIK